MAACVVVPCLDGGASSKNREQCTVNSVRAYINIQSSQKNYLETLTYADMLLAHFLKWFSDE